MKGRSGVRIRHRVFAGLLAIGIVALLVSTISLVINQAVRTRPASAAATLPLGQKPVSFTNFLSSYIQHHNHITPALLAQLERPYVTFTAETLDPSTDDLTGTLSVILPPALPPFIRDAGGNQVFDTSGSTAVAKPQYANDDITVKLLVTRTALNSEKYFTIPLKDFSAGSVLGLHEFPVTIPMNGYAGWYPQDDYTATLTVALALPDGWTPSLDSGPHSTIHTVDGGTVADDYNVDVKPTPASFNGLESNALDSFAISISRDWYDQFFVLTVAIIPILFALIFLHLLFVATARKGTGRSFEHFTEALVVSILSVLPLRVVLVPGDISGLTRVDLVLGIGLVLIVTVSAGKYVHEIWRSGGGGPREEHETEALLEHPTREDYEDEEPGPPVPSPA